MRPQTNRLVGFFEVKGKESSFCGLLTMASEYFFTAELWMWDARKSDSWTFISVPPEESDELRERAAPGPGFGSIPVEVTIGSTTWCTSVFPDKKSGVFVLPVKAAVRKAESIEAGHQAAIALRASL